MTQLLLKIITCMMSSMDDEFGHLIAWSKEVFELNFWIEFHSGLVYSPTKPLLSSWVYCEVVYPKFVTNMYICHFNETQRHSWVSNWNICPVFIGNSPFVNRIVFHDGMYNSVYSRFLREAAPCTSVTTGLGVDASKGGGRKHN